MADYKGIKISEASKNKQDRIQDFLATYEYGAQKNLANKLFNKDHQPKIINLLDAVGEEYQMDYWIKVLEESLEKIQNQDYTEEQLQIRMSSPEAPKELSDFLQAIQEINKLQLSSGNQVISVNKNDWGKIANRFLKNGGSGIIQRDLNVGSVIWKLKQGFAQSMGRITEDLVKDLLSNPAVQEKIKNEAGIVISKDLPPTVQKTGAFTGTIRTKYNPDKKSGLDSKIGKPLRDVVIYTEPTENGGNIVFKEPEPLGISVKRYNLADGQEITIGKLNFQNFIGTFQGQVDSFYIYRTYKMQPSKENGVAYWLVSQNIGEIYKGEGRDGFLGDKTSYMVINGRMISVDDFLESTEINARTIDMTHDSSSVWFTKEAAENLINEVHKSKIKVYNDLGDKRSLFWSN